MPHSALPQSALDQLFVEARSHHAWTDTPVATQTLHDIYELMKWGPTSANGSPARIVFVTTPEGREKLNPALSGSNVTQVAAAPVTAIIAWDEVFYDEMAVLFPQWDAKPMYVANPALSEATAFRNSSLQGAYFIIAARALGLDVCPMSGFDNAKLDDAFFAGTTRKSNFIATLGYGDDSKLTPRNPRLAFETVVKIV